MPASEPQQTAQADWAAPLQERRARRSQARALLPLAEGISDRKEEETAATPNWEQKEHGEAGKSPPAPRYNSRPTTAIRRADSLPCSCHLGAQPAYPGKPIRRSLLAGYL